MSEKQLLEISETFLRTSSKQVCMDINERLLHLKFEPLDSALASSAVHADTVALIREIEKAKIDYLFGELRAQELHRRANAMFAEFRKKYRRSVDVCNPTFEAFFRPLSAAERALMA